MQPPAAKKYVGYIRVSNKDHENSLPAQQQLLRDYAARHHLDLQVIYEEEKSAFGKQNRKIFTQMINHLKQDDVGGVVFHKVDRSARNVKDFALMEGFFESKDIRVIEGEFDTKTAQGRFQFRLFCNMAVWYSENLSEEVNAKMRSCLERGYYPSVAYFGYRKARETDPDPKLKYPDHNARYVREIFELYDTGNHSFVSIAKLMRDRGVKQASTKGHVERILSNKFYIGICEWKRVRGPLQVFQGKHDPLIGRDLFERVQARRENRTRSRGGYGKDTYSRLILCECGHPLSPETPTSRAGKRIYSYLRCHHSACEFRSITRDHMENLIVAGLRRFQLKEEFFAEYREAMDGMSTMIREENKDQRDALNTRLAQIESEMERVRQGYVRGLFEAEEAEGMKRDLENERQTLLQRLDKETGALDAAYFKTAQEFLKTFQTLADSYKTASPDLKREILLFLFSKRELARGKLLLKPTPLLEQVSIIANLACGWAVRPKSEIRAAIRDGLMRMKRIIQRNDFTHQVTRLVAAFTP